MTHTKKIILFPLALVVVYLGLLAVVQVIIKSFIPKVEGALKDTLAIEEVKINRYMNLPFFSVTARDVDMVIEGETVLYVEKIRFQYSLLSLFFNGPGSVIRKVKITRADLKGSLGSVTGLLNRAETNQNTEPPEWLAKINSRLVVDAFNAELNVVGLIGVDIQAGDLAIRWKENRLWVDSNLFVQARKGDFISYVRNTLVLDLDFYDLRNALARGEMQILNMNLGGMDLLENVSLPFSISNELIFDLGDSPVSSFLSQTNGNIHFHVKKMFTLFYHRFDELHVLEHMFEPGVYEGMFDLSINRRGVSVQAQVGHTNDKKTFLRLSAGPGSGYYSLKGEANSKKWGSAAVDLRFEPGNAFPSGTASTRDVEYIGGLSISGDARVTARGNKLLIRGKGLHFNGGRIGTTGATLIMHEDGGVSFEKVPWYVNAPVDGMIKNADVSLNVGLNNIPGSAIVNNIGFDIFGLGSGAYNGGIRIYNEGEKFKIKGGITGYFQGKRHAEVSLELTDEHLELTRIYFPPSQFWTRLSLDFLHPFKDRTLIRINGQAKLGEKISFPVRGEVLTYIGTEKASIDLRFDNAVGLKIDSVNSISRIRISTSDYSMKTFGLPGHLDGNVGITLRNSSLQGVDLNLIYKYNKRKYRIRLLTDSLKKGNLPLKQFIIALDDEKVYGTGKLWETRNRLNAKIVFGRGGALKFESSFEKINGLLNLKNVFIKNFFDDKRDVFFSMDMNFSGDLLFPNYQIDRLNIINHVKSSPFSMTASGISRRKGFVSISSLVLRSRDLNTRLSAGIRFKEEGVRVNGKGVFLLGGIVDSGFDLRFEQTGKKNTIRYNLFDIKVGKEPIHSFGGTLTMEGKRLVMTSAMPGNGVTGSFYNGNKKDWDIDVALSRLSGKSKGAIIEDRFQPGSGIDLKMDLKLLSFVNDVFKSISGGLNAGVTLEGSVKDPRMTGKINIANGFMSIANLELELKNFSGTIPLNHSKMIFEHFRVPSSSGVFLFDGYIEFSQFLISYIDLTLKPYPGEEAWLDLSMQSDFIKLLGNLYINKVRVAGPPLGMNLTGEATARNANIFVGLQPDEGGSEEGVLEGIKWNLLVHMGNGVKFGNQFIDTTLSAGQSLQVLGSIGDGSLSLKGDVDVSRGVLTYLQQDFTIIEGSTASFSGHFGDPIPYVSIQTKTYIRDPDEGRIEVILTFEGKLTKISLKDFYAKNSTIGRNELFALLGFQPLIANSSGTNQSISAVQNVAMGGWNALENTFIFNPIANTLRRTLGLDLVLIRSQALGNIFETTIFGYSTNIDAISIIEGTSLTFGKYLFSNLFVEYELSFERNDLTSLGLEPMHSVGVGLDWQNFFLGWKYGPEELGTGLNYEHSLDFQFHQKF